MFEITCTDLTQGLVTAAQKLQRKKLVSKFEDEIKQAYGGK